jgi:hypothetical protein
MIPSPNKLRRERRELRGTWNNGRWRTDFGSAALVDL